MVQITIDVPDEMKELPSIYWMMAVQKIREEQEEKRKKITRIRAIAAKSKASDKDVEEIVNDIEAEIEKHYSQY